MTFYPRPHRTDEHAAARQADKAFFTRNADLTRPLHPIDVCPVPVADLDGSSKVHAILPERVDILGQRLTYTQVARGRIPQLLERVGFGGVSFGLVGVGSQSHDDAELVPLQTIHLPQITRASTTSVSHFRSSVKQTINELGATPVFIRSRNQILAALQRPKGDQPRWRQPWYSHLPMDLPPSPDYSSEHSRALREDPSTWQTNWDFDRPMIPIPFEGKRLDGVWRYQNVVVVYKKNGHDRSSRTYSLKQLTQLPMLTLLERVAFGGVEVRLCDDEEKHVIGSLHAPFSHDAIWPGNTGRANAFWRDPESVFYGSQEFYRFLRLGNRILAAYCHYQEPIDISRDVQV